MHPSRRNLRAQNLVLPASVTLTVFFAIVYRLFTPSLFYQPFDSLSYGYYTEQNGIRMMLGNHPLGHFVLGLPYALAHAAGTPGHALPWLGATNSLVSALCLGVFCVLNATVHRLRVAVAVGLALVLGGGYFFWWYSGTADIYHVALLFQVLAWGALVYELRTRGTLWLTGCLAGLGLLAHQVNVLFVLPVFLLAVMDRRTYTLPRLVSFFAAMGAAAAFGYFIFGVIATGSFEPSALFPWIRGYVGQTTYGGNVRWEQLPGALVSTASAMLTRAITPLAGVLYLAILLLLLVPFGLWLLFGARDQGRVRTMGGALLQTGVTWLSIFWWEPAPQNPKFWMLCFIPFLLAVGYCWEDLCAGLAARLSGRGAARTIGRVVAAAYFPVLGLLLLFYTYRFAISFQRLPNQIQQAALDSWVSHSAPEELLFTDSSLEPFLRYWADRPHTVSIFGTLQAAKPGASPLAAVGTLIDDVLCRDGTVLYTPLAIDSLHPGYLAPSGVTRADLHALLDAYSRSPVFTYVSWIDGSTTPVYRLLPATDSCTD